MLDPLYSRLIIEQEFAGRDGTELQQTDQLCGQQRQRERDWQVRRESLPSSGTENDGFTSGNTTNMMTGRRDPVEVEEEEGEEEELAGVTTRSGAGSAPDRSASGMRGLAASGGAE